MTVIRAEHTLLIIEDNLGDARLIREFLREKGLFELKWVEKLSDGIELLSKEDFDAILLDITLPDSSGMDTLKRVYEKYSDVPIIILTGNEDEEFAIKALQTGAQDYLVKGSFDSELLLRSIRYAIERKEAERKLRESEKRYRTTFEHTGTAMVMIKEDTILSLVNSEFEKLSGYKKEEIEGKMSWTQFVHPDDLEWMKKYHFARRKGEYAPKRYEFRFIDRKGNVKYILLSIPNTWNKENSRFPH